MAGQNLSPSLAEALDPSGLLDPVMDMPGCFFNLRVILALAGLFDYFVWGYLILTLLNFMVN